MARRSEKTLSAILFQLSGLRVFVSLRAVGAGLAPARPCRTRDACETGALLKHASDSSTCPPCRRGGPCARPPPVRAPLVLRDGEYDRGQRVAAESLLVSTTQHLRAGREGASPLPYGTKGTIEGGCITIGESVGRDDAAPSRGAGGGAEPPPLPYGTRGTIAGGCITIGESVGRDHGIFERGGRGRTPRLRHRRDAARIAAHSLHSDFLLDLSPLRPETLSVSPEPGERGKRRPFDRQAGAEDHDVPRQSRQKRRHEVRRRLVVDAQEEPVLHGVVVDQRRHPRP